MREIRIGPATKIDLLDPVGDDATGRWVLPADGIAYRPKYVPFGVAATFFDLTICGMGLFVRPISREVGDNESNAFRVIGGIMRRSAKAAPPYVRVRRGACAGDRLGRGCSRDGR